MNQETLHSILLSFRVAAISTALVLPAGVALAYVLSRRRFPGRGLLDIVFTMPLVLPPTVTGYYLVVILGRNGLIGRTIYEWTGWNVMFTVTAAVVAAAVVSLPLMIRASQAAIESVDEELVAASMTLGRSELETALRVIIPLAGRGILAGAMLAFARALGEFGATLMLAGNIPGRTTTAPIAIYSAAAGGDWHTANFMVIVFSLVSANCLFIVNRQTRSRIHGT